MGLLANLRKNAPTEGSSTTTSSGKNGAAAARPVLARAGAGAAAAPKAKPTLLRGAKTETPASQVSEDHEPPEHSEPPVEPPEQRRTRGPNKAKGSNSAEVLAMFHVAAIKAGLSPEFAQEHYQAWQAATAG